jgi:hypothetical protein
MIYIFFMNIFSLPLVSQSNLPYHLDLKKYLKNVFNNYIIFQRSKIILIIKK